MKFATVISIVLGIFVLIILLKLGVLILELLGRILGAMIPLIVIGAVVWLVYKCAK